MGVGEWPGPVRHGQRVAGVALWLEILLAQRSGTWHDVRTCGNITNFRASRARKKVAASAEAE
jgi:hypothetical protein